MKKKKKTVNIFLDGGNKYKEFVMENRNVDLQWVADESYQDLFQVKQNLQTQGLNGVLLMLWRKQKILIKE